MSDTDRTTTRALHLVGAPSGAIAVLAAWVLLQLWGIGKAPFHTKGEPREAIVVQEIVRENEWILPRRNGVEMPRKPPLFHWLGAAAALANGRVDEASVRFPSVLLSGLGALLLFGAAAHLLGARAALISALALLTSFEWLRAATGARVDMTLAFGLVLAFVGLLLFRVSRHPRWLVLLYAGVTWATLAKGPVGIALPLLQVVILCAVDLSPRFALELRPLRGLSAVVLVAGAWYVLAASNGGTSFLFTQILDENVFRFLGDARLTGGHRHSVLYLFGMLLAGFLPWTILLPSVAVSLWTERRAAPARETRHFAALWVAVVFAFYCVPVSKRGVYLLPLYPAACLLIGWWADAVLRGEIDPRWLERLLAPLAWSLAAALAFVGLAVAGHAIGLSAFDLVAAWLRPHAAADVALAGRIASAHPVALEAALAGATAGAVLTAFAARGRRSGGILVGLFFSVACIEVIARQVVLPQVAAEQTRRRYVAEIRKVVPDIGDIHAYRSFDYGVVFYAGGRVPVYKGSLHGGPRYLLMSEGQWNRLPPLEREQYERIPDLDSPAGGGLGRLVVLQRLAPPEPAAPTERDGG
jgi:4-amino-4-deoxy-L-arabinose transferase-like glycosyltransferase